MKLESVFLFLSMSLLAGNVWAISLNNLSIEYHYGYIVGSSESPAIGAGTTTATTRTFHNMKMPPNAEVKISIVGLRLDRTAGTVIDSVPLYEVAHRFNAAAITTTAPATTIAEPISWTVVGEGNAPLPRDMKRMELFVTPPVSTYAQVVDQKFPNHWNHNITGVTSWEYEGNPNPEMHYLGIWTAKFGNADMEVQGDPELADKLQTAQYAGESWVASDTGSGPVLASQSLVQANTKPTNLEVLEVWMILRGLQ